MESNKKFKLGELLLSQGLIDEDKLEHALHEHKRTGLLLGKIIVRLGFVSQEQMSSILGTQIKLKSKKLLGEILIDQGLVSEDDVKRALKLQQDTNKRLGQCLVQLNLITEEKILEVLSAQLEIPQIKLANFNIEQAAVAAIPEEMARQHKVVPLYVRANAITVAMADPTNLRTLDFLKFKTQFEVEPVMATEKEITKALDRVYGSGSESLSAVLGASLSDDLETVEDRDALDEPELTDEEGSQVVRIVTTIINEAIMRGASDIHIEPQETHLQLRYRIDGDLVVMPQIPGKYLSQVISRLKIMAKMNIAEKRKPQDGRFTIRLKSKEVDMRVSSFPSMLRKRGVVEKIVMRILDAEAISIPLNDMGFQSETLQRLKDSIFLPNGIILVTGPTGSGKSTTLYACIREVNRPEVNISTMEDPVELNLEGVTQGQINKEAKFDFAAGMKALLRQDPDIIMLGEMRDTETATMAIEAALTGHLVLSTLHTNDASGAFPRLLEMGLEPFLVTTAVKGVLAQRLVKRICKKCKYEVDVDAETRERLHIPAHIKFFKGKGCDACNDGYKGRAAIHEFLVPNEEIRSLILRHASADEIKKVAMERGKMLTLRQSALDKCDKGITTLEEALLSSAADYD